jgi:aerobic-type carbon monoxide dehydrogenase small subunit (CoxS/CutS family)
MPLLSFILNHEVIRTDERPGMVLLEFVREVRGLSGTKEACREGECGACTVLVGRRAADGVVAYRACASCLLPLGDLDGCHVVTVEGLSGKELTLVQRLIVDHGASQCGFCTPGIVLSLTGFCLASPTLAYEDALDALDGNLCRCTGYVAIRNAACALAERLARPAGLPGGAGRLEALVAAGVVPGWFLIAAAHWARVDLAEHAFYATPDLHYDPSAERGRPFAYYAYGTSLTEVLLDCVRGAYFALWDALRSVRRDRPPPSLPVTPESAFMYLHGEPPLGAQG